MNEFKKFDELSLLPKSAEFSEVMMMKRALFTWIQMVSKKVISVFV